MATQRHGYLLWVKAYADSESRSKSFHATIEEARDAAAQYFSSRAELQITRTGEGASHTWMFDYDTQVWVAKSRKVSPS
jgi:hypothetical protein